MNPKNQNFFSLVLKLLFLAGLLVLIMIPFLLWTTDYDEFITTVASAYNIKDKELALREKYLTEVTFNVLRIVSSVLAVILLISTFLFRNTVDRGGRQLYIRLRDVTHSFLHPFYNLSKEEILIFLGITLCSLKLKIWYFFKIPFLIDEAFSYVYFVSNGFFVTATYYPAPNNHILSNLISCIFHLATNNALLVMRLPVLITGLMLGFILFSFFKRHFSSIVAFTAYLFYSLCFELNFYAVQGRGYMLLCLCSFIILALAYKYITLQKRIYLALLLVFSVAGFYCIPTFLYPFSGLIVFLNLYFLIKKNYSRILEIDLSIVLVIVGTLLVYLPVFLISGVSSVAGNSWVKPLNSSEWFSKASLYFVETANWLFTLNRGGIIILTLIALSGFYFSVRDSTRRFHYLILFQFIIPLFILVFQKVLPYQRIWIYLLPLIGFWFGLICEGLKKKYLRLIYLVLLTSALLLIDLNELKGEFGFYHEMNASLEKVWVNRPQRVLCEEDTYFVFLKYYGIKKNQSVHVDNFINENADYDYLILKPDSKINTKNFKIFTVNQSVVIYERL